VRRKNPELRILLFLIYPQTFLYPFFKYMLQKLI
jgi:hypothetical protein